MARRSGDRRRACRVRGAPATRGRPGRIGNISGEAWLTECPLCDSAAGLPHSSPHTAGPSDAGCGRSRPTPRAARPATAGHHSVDTPARRPQRRAASARPTPAAPGAEAVRLCRRGSVSRVTHGRAVPAWERSRAATARGASTPCVDTVRSARAEVGLAVRDGGDQQRRQALERLVDAHGRERPVRSLAGVSPRRPVYCHHERIVDCAAACGESLGHGRASPARRARRPPVVVDAARLRAPGGHRDHAPDSVWTRRC